MWGPFLSKDGHNSSTAYTVERHSLCVVSYLPLASFTEQDLQPVGFRSFILLLLKEDPPNLYITNIGAKSTVPIRVEYCQNLRLYYDGSKRFQCGQFGFVKQKIPCRLVFPCKLFSGAAIQARFSTNCLNTLHNVKKNLSTAKNKKSGFADGVCRV